MDVALTYDPHTDGAPLVVSAVKPGVWLWLCRSCLRNSMEASQHDALMTATSHLFLSPMWGCKASEHAAHRQEHHTRKENAS